MKKSRRQFLRNVALGVIGTSVAPVLAKTSIGPSKITQQNCNALTQDGFDLGPAYIPGSPDIVNGVLAGPSEPGQRLFISGVVRTLNCSEVIPNTEIDIWQANSLGEYSENGDWNLRGKTYTNSQGFYSIETIVPPQYFAPGLNRFRPAHLHFNITAPGYPTFTTQTYFQGDSEIPNDAPGATNSDPTFDPTNRILPFTINGDGAMEINWDIIINGNGVLGIDDNLNLTKGMIYSVSPNPFEDEIKIEYSVFNTANIKIEIYNLHGVLVAEINKNELSSGRYMAIWKPEKSLSSGVYFCALKYNDIQVHHKKIIKK